MVWVKLDDRFPEHPKIDGLDDSAFALHVKALCYSNRNTTDGFIPTAAAARMGGAHFKRSAQRLLASGVWESLRDGYEIHDYLDYQPSRTEVMEHLAKGHAAKVAGGKARAATAAREGGRFTSSTSRTTSGDTSSSTSAHQPRSRTRPRVSLDTGTTRKGAVGQVHPIDFHGVLKRMP